MYIEKHTNSMNNKFSVYIVYKIYNSCMEHTLVENCSMPALGFNFYRQFRLSRVSDRNIHFHWSQRAGGSKKTPMKMGFEPSL